MVKEMFRFSEKNQHRLSINLLIIIPFALFWQTTGFDLVWDDIEVHIVKNPFLQPLSLKNLLYFWQNPYEQLYIPISYNAWSVLTFIFGDSPFIYHFTNIILHITNGILVFFLVRFFAKDQLAALMGTLVFLVHPIQVESVAWVSEMRGLLSSAFCFGSILVYLKSCNPSIKKKKNQFVLLILSWFLFVLSILSKPSSVVMPLFAITAQYYLFRPSILTIIKRAWFFFVPILILIVFTSTIQNKIATYPLWAKPFIWGDATAFYLYKLINPIVLSPSYTRTPMAVLNQWWVYLIWIIPLGIAGLSWFYKRSHPIFFLAFVWFIIGFLPVSGLMKFTFQHWSTVADRYLYLSMPGIAIGIAGALGYFSKKGLYVAVGIAIIILGARSAIVQIPIWQNSLTLWSHCIEVMPNEYRAYTNRGRAHLHNGNLDDALSDFNKSISINKKESKNYNNRGKIYSLQKRYKDAYMDFSRAIQLNPSYADAFYNRGLLNDKLNRLDPALADYNMAIQINPHSPEYYNNRGIVLGLKNKGNKAISDFNKAISLKPRYADAYNNRAVTLYFMGEFEKALIDLEQAEKYGMKIDNKLLEDIQSGLETESTPKKEI